MLNIALVGCGRISVRHAELLGSGLIEHARLAAVCDIDPAKAKAVGTQYKVPYYTDMYQMAEQEKDVDIISLLTPSGLHAEHVVTLAPYRKHLIVEKPMALSLDDADSMIQTCDEYGIKLFVIKQNRFNVPVMKLKEAIARKRFGKLVMGTIRVRWCREQSYYDLDPWRGTWAFDGGVFANQASHHIDLLEWMMGDVESVFAKSATALVDIETEDTGIAVLKFRNGALGVIEATTATRPKDLEGSISILGENGTVEIGGFAVNEMKTWNFRDLDPADLEVKRNYSVNPPNVYGFGHKAYYEHVVDCILNNKKALIDGLEGRKSLELISAIYESIETGKEVYLRFKPQKCKLGMKH
jgi:UDP-N-acetyl-2-amino-2-deoxyglucuronate dehydrogenase